MCNEYLPMIRKQCSQVTCQMPGHVTAVNDKPWLTMRAISQHLINEFLSDWMFEE
jgi:hypothetical protein